MTTPSERTVVIIISFIMVALVFAFAWPVVATTLEDVMNLEAKKAFAEFKNVMLDAKRNTVGVGDNIQIGVPGYYVTFFEYTEELAGLMLESDYSEYIKDTEALTGCRLEEECMCLIFLREGINYVKTNKYAIYSPPVSTQHQIINTTLFDTLKDEMWPGMTEFMNSSIRSLLPNSGRTMKIVECEPLRDYCQCNKCALVTDINDCEEISGCKIDTSNPTYRCVVDELSSDASNVKTACPIMIQEKTEFETNYYTMMSLASPIRFDYLLLTKEIPTVCNFLWDTSDNEVLVGIGKDINYEDETYNKIGAHQACLRQFDLAFKREVIDELDDVFKIHGEWESWDDPTFGTVRVYVEWLTKPGDVQDYVATFSEHDISIWVPNIEWLVEDEEPPHADYYSYYFYNEVTEKYELHVSTKKYHLDKPGEGEMYLEDLVIQAPSEGAVDQIPFTSTKTITVGETYKTPSDMIVRKDSEKSMTIYWSEHIDEEDDDAQPCICINHQCTKCFGVDECD